MKLTKRDIGRLIVVEYLDHACGSDVPAVVQEAGWLGKVDRKYIVLQSNRTPGQDFDNSSANQTILKSTIKNIQIIDNW